MGKQRLSNNPSSCPTSACPGFLCFCLPSPKAPSLLHGRGLWLGRSGSPLDNVANNLAKHGASHLAGPGLGVALDHDSPLPFPFPLLHGPEINFSSVGDRSLMEEALWMD